MTISQAFQVALQYRQSGRFAEAEAIHRQILAVAPQHADALHELGFMAHQAGRNEMAVDLFRQVAALKSTDADAYNNLGAALRVQGRFDEAISTFRQAIALHPGFTQAHWNLSRVLLLTGRLKEGWEEFAWRLKLPPLARPDLTTPLWNGEDLSGRTLLIHQEGGFGDVIHFIRYLPILRARGPASLFFEGGAPILPLMKIQPGISGVIERGQPLPSHEFHCSPQSFPRIFGTDLPDIPADIPYLAIDQEKQSVWRRKLSGPPYRGGGQRQYLVGLNWAGSDLPADIRSRTLDTFAPLAQIPNVTFVSLQKGAEATQSAHAPPGMRLVDAAAEIADFSELAALVSCLDAVATVDTAAAHLAGALGISTWILLPTQADFRWMTVREDSPWYPTVRLFRQQDSHSWEEPVQRMAALLQAFTHAPQNGS